MERSDLELVVAVRDQGSLSAAALTLDLAPPVVTKRLAALEARLGQRLFQRTTRRVSPTAEGETVCERARVLLRGFSDLEAELQERKAEPTGLIRLAATLGFGRLWLGPALASFQERYPRIDIQLQLTEQLPDLAAEGLDGAIWLWQVEGRQAAQWVSRRLARNQRVLVASPRYIRQHGLPASLDSDNPPPAPKIEPYKTHLAYVKERRSDKEAEDILDEALSLLRTRRKSGDIIF